MTTDEELIKEISRGNQAAMEVLIKRHYKMIFAYIYRSLGDYHISYDITQEVLIKVIKSIKTYKEDGKFKNWLMKIAVNTCNDYHRSSSFNKIKNHVELDSNIVDEESNILDIMSRKIERQKIKEAIIELPDYQRNVLILKYYHDLKIKDIASMTQANESTVKSRLKQGLEKLKHILERSDARGQIRKSI